MVSEFSWIVKTKHCFQLVQKGKILIAKRIYDLINKHFNDNTKLLIHKRSKGEAPHRDRLSVYDTSIEFGGFNYFLWSDTK